MYDTESDELNAIVKIVKVWR